MKYFLLIAIIVLRISTVSFGQTYVWKQVNSGDMKFVGSFLTHNGIMYAGCSNGIYVSLDSGSNWQFGAFGISTLAVSNFRKSIDGKLYGLTDKGPIRSINDGDTWGYVPIDSTPVPFDGIIGMEVASNGDMYILNGSHDTSFVLFSTNSGRTWSLQSIVVGRVLDIVLDTKDKIFIANYDMGLFCSSDKGVSFLLQDNIPSLNPRTVFVNKTNDLFANFGDGFFCRKNGSTNFETTNLVYDNDYMTSMLSTDVGRMYVSTTHHGVLTSIDGINWTQIVTGLNQYTIYSLGQSPTGAVYCGTSTGQIYRLEITNSISDTHGANFLLTQNPASSSTSINYTLDKPSFVTLSLVDIQGRVVQQLTKSWMDVGSHDMPLDVSDLPNGVYTVLLRTNDELMTTKLVVSR